MQLIFDIYFIYTVIRFTYITTTMQSKFSSMRLKEGYEGSLIECVYNGPPQSIYKKHHIRHNYNENDLSEAIIKCSDLMDYIENPTEKLIATYIEHHGTLFLSSKIEINRNLAIAIIKKEVDNFEKYDKIYNFTDVEILDMFYSRPEMIKYIKNQTYAMCIDAINRIVRKNSSKIMTNMFYGFSSLFDVYIPTSTPELIKCDLLTDNEIRDLYDIMKKHNPDTIRCMNPKYVDINDFADYCKKHTYFLKTDYFDKFIKQKNLSEEELQTFYSNIFGNDITMIQNIPHNHQTEDMINMVLSAPLSKGIQYYQYLKNIDAIGKDLYLNAFEQNKNHISEMPDQYKTHEICMDAVLYNPQNIAHTPYNLQTQEMCHIAGMTNCNLIKYCKYIDADVLSNVHKQKISEPRNTRFDFVNSLSEEQIIQVMRIMPLLLKIIRKRTHNIIVAALETNGYALEHVPKDKRTDEYIGIALSNQPKASKFIL